jgi:sugar phosphate isomerase/epimerase
LALHHNPGWEVGDAHGGLGLTAKGLLETRHAVGHPAFTLCYDPGNIIYYTAGELRPETDVTDLAGHVSTVIIKDCVVRDGKPDVQVTPGDGLVDFPSVLGTLKAAGFDGPMYVECVGGKDFPRIDLDLAFTRGYVGGIMEALR